MTADTHAVQPGALSITPLKELCIAQVAHEFQRNTLTKVPAQYHGKLVHLLPLDLALELAGQAILDESYWERRSKARWTNCDVLKHGGSFKQLYFERNLQDTIEEFDADKHKIDDLKRLLAFSQRFVRSMSLVQLPSHLELDILFDGLCNSLNHFTLHYGMRDVGMDYDRAVFGMKLSDCRSLARCLEYCETLVSLDLSCNLLDDDKLRMLASGLVNNLSVVDINLADNRIADRGVRAFAKLLHVNSVIQIVNLSNNQIHSEGGRALARALRTNTSVSSLNLRLNRLGEDGGRAIFDVLREHPSLTYLNMAHNALGLVCAKSIAKLLGQNKVMKELDISGNEVTGEGGAAVRDAVVANTTLEHCDVALSGMTQSDCLAITDTLHSRAEARARARFAGLST